MGLVRDKCTFHYYGNQSSRTMRRRPRFRAMKRIIGRLLRAFRCDALSAILTADFDEKWTEKKNTRVRSSNNKLNYLNYRKNCNLPVTLFIYHDKIHRLFRRCITILAISMKHDRGQSLSTASIFQYYENDPISSTPPHAANINEKIKVPLAIAHLLFDTFLYTLNRLRDV